MTITCTMVKPINMKRNIDEILSARKDLSPFLIHLTRNKNSNSAKDNLIEILDEKILNVGSSTVSSFKFVNSFPNIDETVIERLKTVSFSETPIEEIHCLLDIQGRATNLSQYGLIFLKNRIITKNRISPVLYVNTNNAAHKRAYKNFINELYDAAIEHDLSSSIEFMAFFESFGENLRTEGTTDFYWEREWRSTHPVSFKYYEIFLGLCPENEIRFFERRYPKIKFIDPKMNPRYFAKKISDRREQLSMPHNIL